MGSRGELDVGLLDLLLDFPPPEALVPLGVLTLVDLLPANDPSSLVARIARLLQQSTQELGREEDKRLSDSVRKKRTYRALTFRVRRHLVNHDGEQVVVGPVRDGEVFARPLLELGIEDVGIPNEDGDDLLADLGEEVEPLEVGREKERLGGCRAQVGPRVKDLELLNWAATLWTDQRQSGL